MAGLIVMLRLGRATHAAVVPGVVPGGRRVNQPGGVNRTGMQQREDTAPCPG